MYFRGGMLWRHGRAISNSGSMGILIDTGVVVSRKTLAFDVRLTKSDESAWKDVPRSTSVWHD